MSDAPDVVSANGGATLVWLDFQNGKTVPSQDALRAACLYDGAGQPASSLCTSSAVVDAPTLRISRAR